MKRQDFAARDAPVIFHARKLADGEMAVIVDNRALRAHAAQGPATAQVLQIGLGLPVHLHRARGANQVGQLHQRRRAAAIVLDGTQEVSRAVHEPKRANATHVVDAKEVVHLG